jgi:hypothetical protein
MKYTESEVLDIIRTATDKDPEEVFKAWVNRKANTPLDLTKYRYPHFVYTFPIILNDGRKVGDITLVSLSGHSQSIKEDLMLRYFGKEDYDSSWRAFSHYTYLDCFLTIRKDFELPEIVEGMFGDVLKSVDANGRPFEYQISWGNPGKESYIYHKWVDDRNCYRFDNDVNIVINHNQINGWLLGDKINENVQTRLVPFLRNSKISEVINE